MAFIFPLSWGHVIIPTDVHSMIFQRGRAQPPTSKCNLIPIMAGSFPIHPNISLVSVMLCDDTVYMIICG